MSCVVYLQHLMALFYSHLVSILVSFPQLREAQLQGFAIFRVCQKSEVPRAGSEAIAKCELLSLGIAKAGLRNSREVAHLSYSQNRWRRLLDHKFSILKSYWD